MSLRPGVLAAAAALALNPATPARAAAADVLVMSGTAFYSPDLTQNPLTRSVSMSGTATVVGTDGVLAAYACSLAGQELGAVAAGVGTVSGACGPMDCDGVAWVRAGLAAEIVCAGPLRAMRATCLLTPNDLVIRSFTFLCEATYLAA